MEPAIVESHLNAINGLADRSLSEACCILHREELAAGFVADDLSEMDCFRVTDPTHEGSLLLQYNPRRGTRPSGSTKSDDCRICLKTITGPSGKGQQFFSFRLGGRLYLALANPFPFMPRHVTISSVDHEPQFWNGEDSDEKKRQLLRIIRDLVALSRSLPQFVAIYNGLGAGASFPNHLHYQVFQLPDGHGPLPIQLAAARHLTDGSRDTKLRIGFDNDYPLFAFRLSGGENEMVSHALELLEQWDAIQGHAATGNLIAVAENNEPCLYFVPRNRLFKKAAGFNGQIGSLEACGHFVCSSDWELDAIRTGRMSYGFLWQLLEAVRPPAARQLL